MFITSLGFISRIFHTCSGHVFSVILGALHYLLFDERALIAWTCRVQIARFPFGCVPFRTFESMCARMVKRMLDVRALLSIEKLIKSLILILLFTLKPRGIGRCDRDDQHASG